MPTASHNQQLLSSIERPNVLFIAKPYSDLRSLRFWMESRRVQGRQVSKPWKRQGPKGSAEMAVDTRLSTWLGWLGYWKPDQPRLR